MKHILRETNFNFSSKKCRNKRMRKLPQIILSGRRMLNKGRENYILRWALSRRCAGANCRMRRDLIA